MLHLQFLKSTQPQTAPANARQANKPPTLAQAGIGQQVTITGYGNLSPAHLQHLQAYGLLPGRAVTVLAQKPVTIVLVEQTELAFESDVARQVFIQ